MATNPRMTTADVRAARSQVTRLMRHPEEHPNRQAHPAGSLIHYALDLESPPLIACEAPGPDGIISSPTPSEVTCPDCMTHEQFPQRSLAIQPESAPVINAYDVLMNAADLLSDSGENPEYDRAIVELTSALIGAGQDDHILMTRILRSLNERF